MVCLPFSDYCDPLVEEMADWEDLVEPILALGRPGVAALPLQLDLARDDRFERVGRDVAQRRPYPIGG